MRGLLILQQLLATEWYKGSVLSFVCQRTESCKKLLHESSEVLLPFAYHFAVNAQEVKFRTCAQDVETPGY